MPAGETSYGNTSTIYPCEINYYNLTGNVISLNTPDFCTNCTTTNETDCNASQTCSEEPGVTGTQTCSWRKGSTSTGTFSGDTWEMNDTTHPGTCYVYTFTRQ